MNLCHKCHYFSGNEYLPCAVHPTGLQQDCADFKPKPAGLSEPQDLLIKELMARSLTPCAPPNYFREGDRYTIRGPFGVRREFRIPEDLDALSVLFDVHEVEPSVYQLRDKARQGLNIDSVIAELCVLRPLRDRRPVGYILQDRNPIPCYSREEWSAWMAVSDRTVARDEINGTLVSTVFLGLDHNHFREDDPILFETMIFQEGEDGDIRRYRIWDEAVQGHEQEVNRIRAIADHRPPPRPNP